MRTSSHVCVRVLPKWIASGDTSSVRLARLVTKIVSFVLADAPRDALAGFVHLPGDGALVVSDRAAVGAADDACAVHGDLEEHDRVALFLLREGEDAERHPLFRRPARSLAAATARCALRWRVQPAGIGGGGCSTFTASSIIGCVYCAAGIGWLST